MNPTLANSMSSNGNRTPSDDRMQSPPAFLDLADSAARLGTTLPDISARVELKRLEHERQRLLHRQTFEQQMRTRDLQQQSDFLSIPFDSAAANAGGVQHLAVSAPTTPPRINAILNGEPPSAPRSPASQFVDAELLSQAVVSAAADKRKSVTYAPTVNRSPETVQSATSNGFARTPGAKSMPASRRTSASEHDEELAGHLQNLTLTGERSRRASPVPGLIPNSILKSTTWHRDEQATRYDGSRLGDSFNAGMMLDEQLDQEMHNAMRNLPTSDDDKHHGTYVRKLSTASAALDLAPLSQTSPRTSFSSRTLDFRDKHSEWPQFTGSGRGSESAGPRNDRRSAVPSLTIPSAEISTKPVSAIVAPSTAHTSQGLSGQLQAPLSRRGSPSRNLEFLTSSTRSVPATPLGLSNNVAGHLLRSPATPDIQNASGHITSPVSHSIDGAGNAGDVSSLSRSAGQYDNASLSFSSAHDASLQYGIDTVYDLNGGTDSNRYPSYGYETNSRAGSNLSSNTGSTVLYHHNGSRYGLGLPSRSGGGPDSKMTGLHGPKHKRGDLDREFNRFAGSRLEDLQGDISSLCKDQHGCRYLQKKLEEGLPEHRDIIFRETFPHIAELMIDPFGNYLCQRLLEYATDEQRNVICESVAQDLVTISLNMHGTRAVQKMIDFLSTRRQANDNCHAQIHSIIVALSLHVVALIRDLNGNHVVQKCLNKLSAEDNQFIYNAVAANCVEVATHRHGCCVLQRCVDHASEHQRIQLVNEITFNSLTLVQDPYGNYVVQYILDLNDNRFSDGVIHQFIGNVCALSVQKFSSNVIEKCIRVAEHNTRKMLIEEILNRNRLEKLLKDSYGNYCVQTALDYAEPTQRALLVEGIRPILPLIRNTPYGRRIQNKLQRDHLEPSFGGYYSEQGNMPLNNQGMGSGHGHHAPGRNVSHNMHHGGLPSDMYGTPNPMYSLQGPALQSQGSFNQGHLNPPLHGLQPHSMDGYLMQSGSSHGQSLQPASMGHGPGFPGVSMFANVNPFGSSGSLNDSYQSSTFGYGM